MIPGRYVPLFGKAVIPGELHWTTPGSYSFTVPYCHNLQVDLYGAGGGGLSAGPRGYWYYAGNGEASYINALGIVAYGGTGAFGIVSSTIGGPYEFYPGQGGSASGGTLNLSGGAGAAYNINGHAWAGFAANSGPGRGGYGGYGANGLPYMPDGGGGAFCRWQSTTPPIGSALSLWVGTGGAPASGHISPFPGPIGGGNGRISIYWS